MKKKTVRAGIVGAGFSATFHYEALSRVYGTSVEVMGVYALDQEQASQFAADRGIRAYDTARGPAVFRLKGRPSCHTFAGRSICPPDITALTLEGIKHFRPLPGAERPAVPASPIKPVAPANPCCPWGPC